MQTAGRRTTSPNTNRMEDSALLRHLLRIRPFPPVVHPRHARELLTSDMSDALPAWTAGYAITSPEHRQLLESLLASLAWEDHGQSFLINGLYGTGKSHLLVLLHLLTVLPAAWTPFLDAHPSFRRYASPLQAHRRLVAHFSLDAYRPQRALEDVCSEEITHALERAGIPIPPGWQGSRSRLDAWSMLREACTAHGYDGVMLLVDELSLFLAGKSPALREADAAFLQFLTGWTDRAPCWLVGALQRNLADVGALRTHSWRQVEDRFQRYTLAAQEMGDVLRDKIIERLDPAAIRLLVTSRIIPAAETLHLSLTARDLQTAWPFHPETLGLLLVVVNAHLSPHRSFVALLQQLAQGAWLDRPGRQLFTVLDFFPVLADDLRCQTPLHALWKAVDQLLARASETPDPALTRACVHLLALLHLAQRPGSPTTLQQLLFDGTTAPSISAIAEALHFLRRRCAYLTVLRHAHPASEIFSLAIDDEVGVQAHLSMQERFQEYLPADLRVVECALATCATPAWPLAGALTEGLRVHVPWRGIPRSVTVSTCPTLTPELINQCFEGLRAGAADGHVLLHWPSTTADDVWSRATAPLTGLETRTFLLWQPRALSNAESTLWMEYAAWQCAAEGAGTPRTAQERQVRQRCRDHADELRPAVADSVRAIYLHGQWADASGGTGDLPLADSLPEALATPLEAGFSARFPLLSSLAPAGIPSPAVERQLLHAFIQPGQALLGPSSLLGEYLERFAVPLGLVEPGEGAARVLPPCWEVLEPLLTSVAEQPLRVSDALLVLQRPPLGLPVELARLALAAAVRTGAVQGLDGFLQPLSPESAAGTASDALVFLAPPPLADMRHQTVVLHLAAHWSLPAEPWALACSQVALRLRAWVDTWEARKPEIATALEDWTQHLHTLPWGWRATTHHLARLTELAAGRQATFDEQLTHLGAEGAQFIITMETLGEAIGWWQAFRTRITLLAHAPLPDALRQRMTVCQEVLATGEASFSQLPLLGRHIEELETAYQEVYHRWHEQVFGLDAIQALRQAFEHPAFRAVKALARLPLPLPASAVACLDALAQARTGYCPGAGNALGDDGTCPRCHRPLGSPSPLPNAVEIPAWAVTALDTYARLFQTHPWAAEIRTRIPRAPDALRGRADGLLAWEPSVGPVALVTWLDDALIAWLCRDRPPGGVRRVEQLRARLGGRDLTLSEAEVTVRDWLDPDATLEEETVLAFE